MTTKVELSNDAKKLLKLRYCKPDEEPEDVYPRVAEALGEHEGHEKDFFEIMANKRFLPNSPTLMNMGVSNMGKACLSGDTVIHIADGDFTIKELAEDNREDLIVFSHDGEEIRATTCGKPIYVGNKLTYKIIFDTGHNISLTEDHSVMLSDGAYTPVSELIIGQSVMPFDFVRDLTLHRILFRMDKHFLRFPIHRIIYRDLVGNIPPKTDVHHLDGEGWNDLPSNLKLLTHGEHASINAMGNKWAAYERSDLVKKHMSIAQQKRFKEHPMSQETKNKLSKAQTGHPPNSGSFKKGQTPRKKKTNHEIIAIYKDKIEPVYDIPIVDIYSNFAANGIFVHNCFVLPIHDSMESIFQTLKDSAMVFQGGGGVGYNFSELRQEGSSLSSGGSSSGVMSFIDLFNSLTEAVKSGGRRRGASMAILNADHPQILDFIKAKLTPGALSNFNLSVLVDNQFMDRVTTDEYIYLRDRKDKRRTVGKYKARDLFNIMTFAAYLTGDPGLMFYDRINRDNPFKEKIKSSNPCIVGNTLIWVPGGLKKAKDIRIGNEIMTAEGTKGIVDKIEHHKSVFTYRIEMHDGSYIEATAAHQFYARKNDEWMTRFLRVDQLNDGDRIISYNTRRGEEIKSVVPLCHQEVYDIHEPTTDTWITNGYISRGCGEVMMLPYESCIAEGTMVRTSDGVCLIEKISKGDKVLSFLEKDSTPIYSEVIKNIPHDKQETIHFVLENGMEISTTQDHNILTIHGWKRTDHLDLSDFVAIAEFDTEEALEPSMNFKLVTYIARSYNRNVYDLALTPIHNFVANGIVVHNCCLGSINLNEHIVDNDIDWSKFEETAEIGSQMLLSINKYSEYPVDECYKQNYKMNRIGLGLMGFADALMKMHIKYDSDETLELIDKITGCMFDVAKKKAPTSASVLSIAPTGSLSILSSCSPSIEPIFSESYIRNLTFGTVTEVREKNEYLRTAHEVSPMWHLKIQAQFQKTIDNAVSKCLRKGTNILTSNGLIPVETFHKGLEIGFEDVKEDIYVFDENWLKQRILQGYYDGKGKIIQIVTEDGFKLEGSPNHKILTQNGWKTLSEISTSDYVKRYTKVAISDYKKISSVDHIGYDHLYDIAITGDHIYLVNGFVTHNTVNLPHDTTIQDIYDVYYNAWKMGCKGVTVFRDGSKGDQVMISKPTSKCDGEACYL